MNLSFSTKLCIVACHSDTPFKKKIIQHNHPLLTKIAHTIYINSSRYDKTIPMIHTSKRDKYAKYNHILSTLNVHQYNILIWMTDELLLTFSLVPLIQNALQRGYHEYKDIIFQTPNYYINPYPLSKINITPSQEDPSLFKSATTIAPIYSVSTELEQDDGKEAFTLNGAYTTSASIAPIHSVSTELEKNKEVDMFMLTGSYTPSSSIAPIHSISNEPLKEIDNKFTLNGSYMTSASVLPVHSISNEPLKEIDNKFTLNGSYMTSATVLPVHSISKEPPQEATNLFTLNGSYMTSASVLPVHSISKETLKEIDNKFTLNGSYTTSASVLPVHSISNEPLKEIDNKFTLNGSYTTSASVLPVHSISNEPLKEIDKFTLNGSYTTSSTILPVQSISNEPLKEIDNKFTMKGFYTTSATILPVQSVTIETQETSNFKLLDSSYYPSKPVVTSHTVSQPTQELNSFKLLHSRHYPSKPVVTGRPTPRIIPVIQRHVLSNTRISFTNILFSKPKSNPKEKPKPPVVPVKETWMQQLAKMQNLPSRVDSMYETVLISFQPLPYVEYCLRKMILHLPAWSHTVVCGNLNTELITLWNLPINVISLDIDMINSEQYNELMLMPSFWELFQGETLLLYQEDSRPLEYSVDPFLHYVYRVLEPGISIRSKSSIVRYLETNPPEEGISEQIYFKHI